MKPLAIVGLDPGTTAGYVVLGLDGQVLTSAAAKNLPLSAIIRQVMEIGQPLIVSTDKARVPSLVEEFSRKVGAEIVHPEQDLTREEKRQLLREENYYYKSHHQQDSLAAALFAYKRYRPRLEKINRYLAGNNQHNPQQHNLHGHEQEFTKIALKEDLHFALIKELVTGIGKEPALVPVIRSVIQENKITKKDFLLLYQKLRERTGEKEILKKKMEQLQMTISQLQHQLQTARAQAGNIGRKINTLFQSKENRLQHRERQLRRQQGAITQLHQKGEELYRFIPQTSYHLLIKKLNTLGWEEFQKKKNILMISAGDIIFVQNPSIYSPKVLALLQDKDLLLLSPQRANSVLRQSFSCQAFSEKFWQENEYFALLKPEILEHCRSPPAIDAIVDNYRQARQQERA